MSITSGLWAATVICCPRIKHSFGEEGLVETPHIDSLADEGALCTSFYGTTQLCAPARASLMTGLYPHATGVPVNHVSLTVFIDYRNCLRCGFGGTFNKMM